MMNQRVFKAKIQSLSLLLANQQQILHRAVLSFQTQINRPSCLTLMKILTKTMIMASLRLMLKALMRWNLLVLKIGLKIWCFNLYLRSLKQMLNLIWHLANSLTTAFLNSRSFLNPKPAWLKTSICYLNGSKRLR